MRNESVLSVAGQRAAGIGLAVAVLVACVPAGEPLSPRAAAGPAPALAASPEVVLVAETGPAADIVSPFGSYLAGRFARTNREIHEAANFYAQALKDDPDNPALLRRTFHLLIADGRIEEAMPLALKTEELASASSVASLLLALADLKTGNSAAALERLGRMPDSGFNALLVPLLKAWTRVALEDPEAAVAALGALSESDLYAPLRTFHTALIQDLGGDHAAAQVAYAEAVEATSGGTLRLVEAYAAFLARRGDREGARALYREYLTRSPDNPVMTHALARLEAGETPTAMIDDAKAGVAEALFDVASALAQDRARDAAQVYIQLALYMRPGMELARTLLGEILEAERRWEEALEVYRQVDPSSPYSWNARIRMASALDRLDRTDEAVAMLHQMAADERGRMEAVITLADILRARERYAESVEAYDQAIVRIEEFEDRHWSLLYARGIALERSKQWGRAESDFLRALDLSPDQPLVLNYLGYSWVEQGTNLERALAMIERAVELKPDDGYIVDSLGWVHYRMGNYDAAVRQLERAVELKPEDPTINDHLGDAYWRVGRILEARFQWRRALSFGPDENLIPGIENKLEAGLTPAEPDKEGS